MKKCSHSAHHSLTELNITPLLDLAFVLLVIFIITTTPIVNDLDLDLPTASRHQKDPPRKANYISVEANGKLWLNKKALDLPDLLQSLVGLRMDDPDPCNWYAATARRDTSKSGLCWMPVSRPT